MTVAEIVSGHQDLEEDPSLVLRRRIIRFFSQSWDKNKVSMQSDAPLLTIFYFGNLIINVIISDSLLFGKGKKRPVCELVHYQIDKITAQIGQVRL